MNTVRNMNSRTFRPSSNDVYIGRAGHGYDGYFGNPFVLQRGEARGSTIERYRDYAQDRMYHDEEFRFRVKSLHGKDLLCFCHPHPCHGDVLLELSAKEHEMASRIKSTPIALPVCPGCGCEITGEWCNVCDVEPDDGQCVVCGKGAQIDQGGLCQACDDSYEAYLAEPEDEPARSDQETED